MSGIWLLATMTTTMTMSGIRWSTVLFSIFYLPSFYWPSFYWPSFYINDDNFYSCKFFYWLGGVQFYLAYFIDHLFYWQFFFIDHIFIVGNFSIYQVEYSAFEPRWRMPCLTHSFNVSTKVCKIFISTSQPRFARFLDAVASLAPTHVHQWHFHILTPAAAAYF